MYRKQLSESSNSIKLFQLKPQLIALEFLKPKFSKVKDVKSWVSSNYSKLGVIPDFENKDMKDEDCDGFYFQVSKVYKKPVQEIRVDYDENVRLLYHFTEFQIKDDNKVKELVKMAEEL